MIQEGGARYEARRKWALDAIALLVEGDEKNKLNIAETGCIPILVKLLHDDSAIVKERVVIALAMVARRNMIHRMLIVKAGGIAPLKALAEHGESNGQLWARRVLSILVENPGEIRARVQNAV